MYTLSSDPSRTPHEIQGFNILIEATNIQPGQSIPMNKEMSNSLSHNETTKESMSEFSHKMILSWI